MASLPIRAPSARPASFATLRPFWSRATLPIPRPPTASSARPSSGSAGSTRWSTTPACSSPKPFVDYSEADFAAMINVNLAGFFYISQKVIPGMLSAGSGHIVNVTATIAELPTTSLPAALASLTKVGLNGVTRALAIEYAGRGIRVNAVSPGAVKTPMHPPELHGFLAGLQPMGRMARAARDPRCRAVSGKGCFRHRRDSSRRRRRLRWPMVGDMRCGPTGD